MQLNQYGRSILPFVEDIFASVDKIEDLVKKLSKESDLVVTVAFDDPIFYGELFQNFQQENAGIQLTQVEGNIGDIRTLSEVQGADFFCTAIDLSDLKGWTSYQLFEDPIILAVPPGHKLYERTEVSLSELKDTRFLMRIRHDFFQKYIDSLLDAHNFKPEHQIECSYALRPQILRSSNDNVVLSTLIAVKGALPNIYPEDIHVVSIKEFRGERYAKYLCWREDLHFNYAMKLFQKYIIDFTRDWVEEIIAENGYHLE